MKVYKFYENNFYVYTSLKLKIYKRQKLNINMFANKQKDLAEIYGVTIACLTQCFNYKDMKDFKYGVNQCLLGFENSITQISKMKEYNFTKFIYSEDKYGSSTIRNAVASDVMTETFELKKTQTTHFLNKLIKNKEEILSLYKQTGFQKAA